MQRFRVQGGGTYQPCPDPLKDPKNRNLPIIPYFPQGSNGCDFWGFYFWGPLSGSGWLVGGPGLHAVWHDDVNLSQGKRLTHRLTGFKGFRVEGLGFGV